MKHHQAKKILKAIDQFMDERNSPRKAESLRDMVSLVDEYIVGTTHAPRELGGLAISLDQSEEEYLRQSADDSRGDE